MSYQVSGTPILTPCVGICELNRNGFCRGCGRSGDEIAQWMTMSDARRRQLMEDVLPRRLEAGLSQ